MSKTKTIAWIIIPSILSFLLANILWHSPEGAISPSSTQLPFFIFLGVIESLAFGVGIWFFVRGYTRLRQTLVPKNLTIAAYISIGWSLVSWWPHDNFHRANGESLTGLLHIEYGFHFTLIVAAAIIAIFFLAVLQQNKDI